MSSHKFLFAISVLISMFNLASLLGNGKNSDERVSVPLETLMNLSQECPRLQELGTNLLNDKEFCDINLEVNDPNTGEKRVFCAHKCILCMRSEKLKEKIGKLVSNPSAKPKLKLPDMSAEVFKNILRFIYTDKIDSYFDLKRNILDLYSIADFLGLTDLKVMIEEYFNQNVQIHDIGGYLQWAKKYKFVKIRIFVLEFARNSLKMTKTDWSEFMEELCVSANYLQKQKNETSAQLEDKELKFECQEMFYSCAKNDDCCSKFCMIRPDWGEGVCQPTYAQKAMSENSTK